MKTYVIVKEKAFDAAIQRKNILVKDMAKKLGISRVYLSALKNENQIEYRPSPKLREKIMKFLDVKFDKIFRVIEVDDKKKR